MFLKDALLPDDMRVYAIGDIHGLRDELLRAITRVEEHLKENPVKRWRLVFLGDYPDRGPDSKGVVETLIALKKKYPANVECLRGNHDQMFLDAYEGTQETFRTWYFNGAFETLLSYGIGAGNSYVMDAIDAEMNLKSMVPLDHYNFYKKTESVLKLRDFVFVHAGIMPGLTLEEQEDRYLLWIRNPFLLSERDHGFVVVHGHTPSRLPEVRRNRIGIDTGAVFYDTELTVLKLENIENNSRVVWGWV